MLSYLLDTDTCIYAIKNRPASIRVQLERHTGHIAISSVTAMELLFGVENSKNRERNLPVIEGFLARLEILDFDQEAAWQTAKIRAELRKAGTPIGPYDAMIAGHARSKGLTVITNNLREFERVAGLRTESWNPQAERE